MRIAESTCCNGSPPAPKPPKAVKEKKPKKEKKDSKKGADAGPDAKDGKSSGKDKGKDAAGAAAIVKAESKPTPFQVSDIKFFTLLNFHFSYVSIFQIPIHRFYFPFFFIIFIHTRHTHVTPALFCTNIVSNVARIMHFGNLKQKIQNCV